MQLTDTKCRTAKGQIKPRKLSDGGGLHLLINPDGAKYWRLAYRWHGKQRTLAVGVYPAVGLMEARAARDEAKRNLAADIDPSVVKQERKRRQRLRLTIPSKSSRASGTKTRKVHVALTTLPKRITGQQEHTRARLPANPWTRCCIR